MAVACEKVLIDFAHARSDPPRRRLRHVGRQRLAHALQTLEHKLVRQVNNDVIFQNDSDNTQARWGNESHSRELRQSVYRRLDRKGDERLPFHRRKSRRCRQNLHLHVAAIGEGIEEGARERPIAGAGHENDEAEDEQVIEEKLVAAVDHEKILCRPCLAGSSRKISLELEFFVL